VFLNQNNTDILKDTTRAGRQFIELGDIPIRSAELRNKTREDIHDMIPDGTIRRRKAKNKLVIESIDFALLATIDTDDVSKNIHFLENQKIFY